MPTQHQIEQAAGITDTELALHISAAATPAARNALELLRMLCACYEQAGFALLQEAVRDCRREMQSNKPEVRVVRDAGHPGTEHPGWDRLYLHAASEHELAAAIKQAARKFWQVWISGTQDGKPGAVLYKPSGAKAAWNDPYLPDH